MYLVTAREMQQMDHETIHSFGIPGRILMENAGSGATAFMRQKFPDLNVYQPVLFPEPSTEIRWIWLSDQKQIPLHLTVPVRPPQVAPAPQWKDYGIIRQDPVKEIPAGFQPI